MQAVLTIGLIAISVLLILVVLVQNSKGGGISSNFSTANQIMGARRGTDFIEKATWTLAIALLVFSLFSAPKKGATVDTDDSAGSKTKGMAQTAPATTQQPAAQPVAPAATSTAK